MSPEELKKIDEEFSKRAWWVCLEKEDTPKALSNFLKTNGCDQMSRKKVMEELGLTSTPRLFASMKEEITHNAAKYKKGQRVQITMASRFGDVGVNPSLEKGAGGYDLRLFVDQFENFSEEP